MKRKSIYLSLLLLVSSVIAAQPTGVDPFYDAVPYSVKKFNKSFLTNQDATVVRDYFENQTHIKPIRIINMNQGYHHGYRIYYNNSGNNGEEQWIQIFTINIGECIDFCEKNNPSQLQGPFQGVMASSRKYGYAEQDITELYDRYKHIAALYYRESLDENEKYVNEMNLVFQKYYSKLKQQTGQMLASGGEGLLLKPLNNKEYSWGLWEQCMEEINQSGFRTIIEYSDPQ